MHISVNAAVDFGNTYAKVGFFIKNELVEFHHGLRIQKLRALLIKKAPKNLIIASVTKSPAELERLFVKFSQKIILGPATSLPIINEYATPTTLGYDRLAAAAGANLRFPDSSVLIIDMGTAIKYDFITAQRAFKGGIISPGMQMRFKALHKFTKKLPLLEPDGIPPLVGDSTAACIRSGVVNGIIAEVNGIIERYNQYPDLRVVLCGGDAPFFESQIKYPKFAASNLVLEGLNRILLHNVE